MRGRPRARRILTGSVGDMGVSSVSSLTSARSTSDSSSFGTISLGLVWESRRPSDCESEARKTLASKLGVVKGDSLDDDMEDWGDELVLMRL